MNSDRTAHSNRTGRRIGTTAVIIVALAAPIIGYLVWAPASAGPPAASAPVSTTLVTTGSLTSEIRVSGTVQYAMKEPVVSAVSGVVTELPASGATIGVGAVAYRVDTRPVTVLTGALPAWRDFASGMTDGEDIRQLEQNLRAFGFFSDDPDARFTWDTTVAIRAWQKSLGLERTGTIDRSMVLFTDQDLRVDFVESRVGALVGAGSPLFQATSLHQIVELNVPSADRGVAVVGAPVTVILPARGSTAGVVETAAAPVSKPDTDGTGSSIVVPVRITVADQAAIADLALAGVSVSFTGTVTDDVLTVPVEALVPISDTQFAVELPRKDAATERSLVPVTVGAFASGRVEISGKKIVAGLAVVVPER